MRRKKPMKRSTKPMKKTQRGWNSTLRNKSPRKQALDRKQKPMLDEYREEFPTCQGMKCHRLATDIHEIASGRAFREAAREMRSCILHLCRECHTDGPDPIQDWPHVKQLALKWLVDPEGFDLGEFNDLVEFSVVSQVGMDEVMLAARQFN